MARSVTLAAFLRQVQPQHALVLVVAAAFDQPALFHLRQQHAHVGAADEKLSGKLLLRDALEAIEIDQDIEMRGLDVEFCQRAAQGLLHQLAGAGDGNPAAKTRMIPGQGRSLDFCSSLYFIVQC